MPWTWAHRCESDISPKPCLDCIQFSMGGWLILTLPALVSVCLVTFHPINNYSCNYLLFLAKLAVPPVI